MSQLNWIVPLLIALIVFAVVVVISYRRLRKQAHTDFRRARGTQHRELVEGALAKVDATTAALRAEIARSVNSRAALDEEERRKLNEALARHLVRTRLVEAPGIGPANVRAIESTIFQHSLADLLHSAGRVAGIGPAKQSAISTWVEAMTSSWVSLQGTNYPGKREIQAQCEARREALVVNQHSLTERAKRLEQLSQTATAALTTLGSPSVDDFSAVLRGRQSKSGHPQLGPYIAGLFAPWANAPTWFNELLSAAQQAEHMSRAR